MKAIPIKYIQDYITALKDCKEDSEVNAGGYLKNMLYCNARINCLNDLLEYWAEDSEEWTDEEEIKPLKIDVRFGEGYIE